MRVWGRPFWRRYAPGILQWLVVNAVMWLAFSAQLVGFWVFGNIHIWWWVACGYTGLAVVLEVLGTRDG